MSIDTDGGLREKLLLTGVDLLRTRGPSALTLREIARSAGVSHGAPRRYFPTHLSLLSAIARQGYAELATRISKALAENGDPRGRLVATARCYVRFGRDEPAMFELMFRHDLLASGQLGLRDVALPLFALLVEQIRRIRPDLSDPTPVAAALWANLHGLVQLDLWGSLALATGHDDIEPVLHAALSAHLPPGAPLAAHHSPPTSSSLTSSSPTSSPPAQEDSDALG